MTILTCQSWPSKIRQGGPRRCQCPQRHICEAGGHETLCCVIVEALRQQTHSMLICDTSMGTRQLCPAGGMTIHWQSNNFDCGQVHCEPTVVHHEVAPKRASSVVIHTARAIPNKQAVIAVRHAFPCFMIDLSTDVTSPITSVSTPANVSRISEMMHAYINNPVKPNKFGLFVRVWQSVRKPRGDLQETAEPPSDCWLGVVSRWS